MACKSSCCWAKAGYSLDRSPMCGKAKLIIISTRSHEWKKLLQKSHMVFGCFENWKCSILHLWKNLLIKLSNKTTSHSSKHAANLLGGQFQAWCVSICYQFAWLTTRWLFRFRAGQVLLSGLLRFTSPPFLLALVGVQFPCSHEL